MIIFAYEIYKKKIDTNWSVDRTGDGKFEPEDIDTKLCTNIIYAFAVIDPSTSKMKVFNPKIDTDGKKLYKKVTGLKTQGVNVWIFRLFDNQFDDFAHNFNNFSIPFLLPRFQLLLVGGLTVWLKIMVPC